MVVRRWLAIALMLCGAGFIGAGAASQPPPAGNDRLPPPVFTDPQRVEKLLLAFPEVDRLIKAFAERSRVPGIANGIIIDGRLAHVGAAGHPNVRTKAPGDADTVFRVASMTKGVTALA